MDESEHLRSKRAQFEQDLLEAHPVVFRIVLSWVHDKWQAENITQEAAYRSWKYMEDRQWKPVIKNTPAFVVKVAVHLRDDSWSDRKVEGWQNLDDEIQQEAAWSISQDNGIENRIYLKELFDEKFWNYVFQGLNDYERQIYYMHEAESMSPMEIAYEMNVDVLLVRYQLTKISAKVRYRADQYLKATKRKSLFDRDA